jgi:FkbM family methyltransferase
MSNSLLSHAALVFPLVSYAQNGEDILLDRLFGGYVGMYMDIGSYDPLIYSNTCLFYEKGWRGVNIEPTLQGHALFQTHRPEDLNLRLAISDQDGEMILYEVIGDRGNSTLNRKIADPYRDKGIEIDVQTVQVRTVRSLIEAHGIEPPDFLSIDVEGHEAAVIRGTPLDSWRPRVLVVEATLPLTTTPSHESWEPILLEQGYLFAAFNGVNRFYLREDMRGYLDRLATPANALDRFVPYEVAAQYERAAELQERLSAEQNQLAAERQQHEDCLRAVESERAEWARQRTALEQHGSLLRGQIEATQSQLEATQRQLEATQRYLRPYQLLDRLGVVSTGYGWARKLKHKVVS